MNGGEVSENMLGRLDNRQYQTGLRKCLNMLPAVEGSASKRPGLAHVAMVANQNKRPRLIPFTYAYGDSYAIEIGERADGAAARFRFHTGGASLQWGDARGIAVLSGTSVSTAADTLTFDARHRLAVDDFVWVLGNGTLPGGLSHAGYVKVASVVDARTVTLKTSLDVPIDLTSTGSGGMWVYPNADVPRAWIARRAITWALGGAGQSVYSLAHVFQDGDAIQFSGGTLYPVFGTDYDQVTAGVTYYVTNSSTDYFGLAKTPGGPEIIVTAASAGSPTGSFLVHRYYEPGDTIWSSGTDTAAGVWVAKASHRSEALQSDDAAHWAHLPHDGTYEVEGSFTEPDLRELHYAQSGTTLTLCHYDHPPTYLRRRGARQWAHAGISISPDTTRPTGLVASHIKRGQGVDIAQAFPDGPGGWRIVTVTPHTFTQGEAVYVEGAPTGIADGLYSVIANITPGQGTASFYLAHVETGQYVSSIGYSAGVGGTVYYSSLSSDLSQTYQITSVDALGVESQPSASLTIANNLDVPGSYNQLYWPLVPGAVSYRVYKRQSGLFGYIGESDNASTGAFKDDNIAPDLGVTPPRVDATMVYPWATTYFDQRRFFAGGLPHSQKIYGTRSGTDADLTYSLPLQDDDRLAIEIASDRDHSIVHMAVLGELLALTRSGEWRITAVNSEALTPTSVAARPQSSVGCNTTAQPVTAENSLFFVAAQGGHVHELGYSFEAQSYRPRDMCVRSAHLFDGDDVVDQAFMRSPRPTLWVVTESGRLLSLTYNPTESVAAWAQHTIGGSGLAESLCVVPEANEDRLYVAVKRGTVRTIERMEEQRDLPVWTGLYSDGGGFFSGYVDATVTPTGLAWTVGDSVTLTTSIPVFAASNVGDVVDIRPADGGVYRARIVSVTAGQEGKIAVGTWLTVYDPAKPASTTVPPSVRAVASGFFLGADTISGLDRWEGETLSVVGDGAQQPDAVVTSGSIELEDSFSTVLVGFPYEARVETLPLAFLQAEGAGQGRTKNVSEVHVRVRKSHQLKVGPASGRMVDAIRLASPVELGEVRVVPTGEWNLDGSIVLTSDEPVPLTLLNFSIEVAIGA